MKRLTADVAKAALSEEEQYYNCVYCKKDKNREYDGLVCYRDGDREMNLLDFIRDINEAANAEPLPEDNGDLDRLMYMHENNLSEFRNFRDRLAFIYCNLCSMAELRDLVEAYENTGMTPAEAQLIILMENFDYSIRHRTEN